MAQKLIGPAFSSELAAAGLTGLPVGVGLDGVIETHVLAGGVYYLVKITCEAGGSAVETRIAETVGSYPCVTEAQVTALKMCLTNHDPAAALPDAAKQTLGEQCFDSDKMVRALALVVMDEINLIRGSSADAIAGMNDRTAAQLRAAWINKYKALL